MSEVYVSPSGSDVDGDGTRGRPWETLPFAESRVVSFGLVGPNMRDDCNINITNTALHRLTAKQTHGPTQSGRNGKVLRYVGTGRTGTTRILASARATGWTVHAGSVWKCNIGTTPIHTLYDNGRRAYKARFPKYVFQSAFPMAKAPFVRAEAGTGGTMIQYPSGSLDPATWGDISQLEVVVQSGGTFIWFTDVVPVQSINTGARQITLSRSTRYDIMNAGNGSQFFCQNALALLTQAGEFFHDYAGLEGPAGTLYYWPWTGVDPNLLAVEIPLMQTAFEFLGTGTGPGQLCHDIELRNLALCYTDFTNDYTYAWTTEGQSGEGHVYGAYDRIATRPQHRNGLITRTNCERITLRNVELSGAGYNGIYDNGYNQGNIDENVWTHGNGQCGHYREGRYPADGDYSRGNLSRNVLANDCGELVVNGDGMSQVNSGHNIVENFEAHRCASYGYVVLSYSFGGGGYPVPPASDIYAVDNIARRLKLRNVNQARGDAGAIDVFGVGSRTGGPINSNTVDGFDIDGSFAEPAMYDAGCDGIFTDNEAAGQQYKNGKIANVQGVPARENADSVGTQTYENVQGVTSFDPDLVPACGVTKDFPF